MRARTKNGSLNLTSELLWALNWPWPPYIVLTWRGGPLIRRIVHLSSFSLGYPACPSFLSVMSQCVARVAAEPSVVRHLIRAATDSCEGWADASMILWLKASASSSRPNSLLASAR